MKKYRKKSILAGLVASLVGGQTFAQDLQSLDQTTLSNAPYANPRAAGMADAFSTLADGVQAPYYNPAGIGGIDWGKSAPPRVRLLNFPFVGASFNKDTEDFNNDFSKTLSESAEVAGESIVKAHAGKRQYGRASSLFSIGYSRMIGIVAEDIQVAALTPEESNGVNLTNPDQTTILSKYKATSTAGFGFSLANKSGSFSAGFFGSDSTVSYFDSSFTYAQISTDKQRETAFSEVTKTYSGNRFHAGLRWVFNPKLRPTLAIVRRDIGNSRLKGKSDSETPGNSDYIEYKEDLTLGFSLSPKLSKSQNLTLAIEAENLGQSDTSISQKFKSGLEWSFGPLGSESAFGLRAGYKDAGMTYGMSVNLGLVQLEYAMHTEDVGAENTRVVEQRHSAVFSVNVRDE